MESQSDPAKPNPEVKTEPQASEPAGVDAGTSPAADGLETLPGATPVEERTLAADFEALQGRITELEQELLRHAAEADNARKRALREIEQARRFGVEKLLADLCPVIDNLERGLAAAEGASVERLREGVELTLKLLLKAAEQHGLVALDPVGQPFQAELHQALAVQPSSEVADGHVLQVMEKGYRLHERLLRPALVVVARSA